MILTLKLEAGLGIKRRWKGERSALTCPEQTPVHTAPPNFTQRALCHVSCSELSEPDQTCWLLCFRRESSHRCSENSFSAPAGGEELIWVQCFQPWKITKKLSESWTFHSGVEHQLTEGWHHSDKPKGKKKKVKQEAGGCSVTILF